MHLLLNFDFISHVSSFHIGFTSKKLPLSNTRVKKKNNNNERLRKKKREREVLKKKDRKKRVFERMYVQVYVYNTPEDKDRAYVPCTSLDIHRRETGPTGMPAFIQKENDECETLYASYVQLHRSFTQCTIYNLQGKITWDCGRDRIACCSRGPSPTEYARKYTRYGYFFFLL